MDGVEDEFSLRMELHKLHLAMLKESTGATNQVLDAQVRSPRGAPARRARRL